MQKFRLKILYRYREIVKIPKCLRLVMTSLLCLRKVKIHLTSHIGLAKIEVYTDFDIKLDGFVLMLAWNYDKIRNYKDFDLETLWSLTSKLYGH